MEFIVRKCQKCGAQVNVIRKCQCEDDCISCCGEKMQELRANEVDAAIEKHVPNYEIMDGNVVAVVNHVTAINMVFGVVRYNRKFVNCLTKVALVE